MTARETAARLGVKLDTVYAYVSRGVLTATRQPGSRNSLFDRDEVEQLARRGRPRRTSRPSALDLIVETGLTTIADQRVRYRGRDACAMARTHSFEETAGWLWTGDEEPENRWQPYPVTIPDVLEHPRDRMRAAVVLAAAAEPFRADLTLPAVTTSARSVIATMVVAAADRPPARVPRLHLPAGGAPISGSLAGVLCGGLLSRRSTKGIVASVNAALVLLTDHELASSTMAARVAASVRADPFSVVLAGLGSTAGPLHAGASALVYPMLVDAADRGSERAIARALETHEHLPGFGHPLYPDGDPRGKMLLALLDAEFANSAALSSIHTLRRTAERRTGIIANIDFALGALCILAGMPVAAGEALFTIARTAGWIAHAIEEYGEPPLRFRAHAVPREPRFSADRTALPSGD